MRSVRQGLSIKSSNRDHLYKLGRGFHERCKHDGRRRGRRFNRYFGDVVKRQATVFAVHLPGESPLSIFGGGVCFDEKDAEVQIKSSVTITACTGPLSSLSAHKRASTRSDEYPAHCLPRYLNPIVIITWSGLISSPPKETHSISASRSPFRTRLPSETL